VVLRVGGIGGDFEGKGGNRGAEKHRRGENDQALIDH